MKKFAFTTLLLGALLGGFTTSASADDCCYQTPSYCDDTSLCYGKFTVNGDWLYWKVEQESLYYADLLTNLSSANVPNSTYDKALTPNFHYTNGFRVGIGYELPGDEWKFGVVYTYIPGHGKSNNTTENSTQSISQDFSDDLASTYKTKWNLNFSYLDIDLARSISCGESFRLSPHIGFRGAWMNQKFHSSSILSTSTARSTNYGYGKVEETLNGYGIEGGLWGEWNIGFNFSFVGHVGGSILYSKFKGKFDTTQVNVAADGTETTPIDQSNRFPITTSTPSVDYFVGLQYAANLCNFDVSAHIGWEQHIFFNMLNQVVNPEGNLSAQGLTLGLAVGF